MDYIAPTSLGKNQGEFVAGSSSSSSYIIVRPLSRITTMGVCAPLRACDGAAPGMR